MGREDPYPGRHGIRGRPRIVRLAHQQDVHLIAVAGSSPSPVLWRAARAEELVWAILGDAHAVHHRRSGQTHVVDSLMVLLLQDVLREPCTLEHATVLLALAQDAVADDAMRAQLADVFGRLEALGLLRRELVD